MEQLRAQRKEGRALVLVRVLERQLGPLGAVAVGAYAGGPLGRPREQRHRLPRATGAQQVVRDALGRRVVRGEQRGSIGVRAAQHLLGQPGGQLLAHERVPEAIAAARTFEHAGRLGLAKRLADTLAARECRELHAREAVVDHGERGQQPLAERLEPLEPPRHDLAQPRRHRDLAGGVHRRRELLGEERVARGRALDGGEGAGPQRPAGGPPRDRREGGAIERTERNFDGGAALEQARAHERERLGERAHRASPATTSRRSPAALRAR